MPVGLSWVALATGAAAAAGGVWLWRRERWPCPPWLVPLLENPYVEAVAGAERLLDRAGVAPGMRVLDAGCGPGRLTLPAAARVGESGSVLAVDLEPRMLERLRARLEARGVRNVGILAAGLGEGRLPADAFDVAFLVTVLGEIREPGAALREIQRALRPGGLLSVTEVLPDPHYQPVARVRALAGEAGFAEARYFPGALAYTLHLVKPGAGV